MNNSRKNPSDIPEKEPPYETEEEEVRYTCEDCGAPLGPNQNFVCDDCLEDEVETVL